MLFKFLKKTETSLHKRKSIWSTFKKAYIQRRNFRKFWLNLDKQNLPKDLKEITNLFVNSESYFWTSKYWRHNLINHYNYINNLASDIDPLPTILVTDYSGLTFLDEFSVEQKLQNPKNLEIYKKEYLMKYKDIVNTPFASMSNDKSIEHNIVLINLYEKLKSKDFEEIFKKINKKIYYKYNPCIKVDDFSLSQHLLLSLTEYYNVKRLIGKDKKKYNYLELGAGYGRTANMILSLEENCKYVIADLPASVYFSHKNIKEFFKNKKILKAFNIDNKEDMREAFEKNDILFVFPHQLNLFDDKTFDISISLGNLCEMERKQIKQYMKIFEDKSKFLYFKVWEISGLPYSFFQYYSVHDKKDYEIKDKWKEHFKTRCFMPNNQFDLGYEF